MKIFHSRGFNTNKIAEYDFTALDEFLDHLMEIHLFPVIEFMGDIFPKNNYHDIRFMWKDFTYQLVTHFLTRYGKWNLMNFRFELWNEPDLHTYNILNFTLIGKMIIAHK